MKNLWNREGTYYVNATVGGKRIVRSLDTGDAKVAAGRAKAIIAEAKAGRWATVDAVRGKRTPAQMVTVAQALDVYRQVAHRLYLVDAKPRPTTVASNAKALLRIIREVRGLSDDAAAGALACSEINAKLWQAYADTRLQEAMDADEDMETARLSTGSTINQARSIFAGKFSEAMREAGVQVERGNNPIRLRFPEYELPPQALIDRTMTEGRALRVSRPDLYAAFLLCFDLGMRSGEACAARWGWIEEREEGGKVRRWMDIRVRQDEGFAPKGRAHKVAMASSVWQQLAETRRQEDEWILPGGTPTARQDLIQRELAEWMRGIGWDGYSKAAHELRKLAGSGWYTAHGAEVACEWLGHKSITTTCKFYAKLTRHPDPVEID